MPITIRIIPVAHPLSANMYGSDKTPPPIAAEHREKIEPLTLPFSSLPKVLSKNVLFYAPPGESGIFNCFMLISASAYLIVLGVTGDSNALRLLKA